MRVDRAQLLAWGYPEAMLDEAIASAGLATGPRRRAEFPPLADGPSGRWEVEVAGWRPAFASELKCHPMKAARLKKRDAIKVHEACRAAGVTAPQGRRAVAFLIVNRYGNFPDPDAPLKSILDALKTAGAIIDDSERSCDWTKPVFDRGPLRTVILIEDISEDPRP